MTYSRPGVVKDFENSYQRDILNRYRTAALAQERMAEYFQNIGMTDVQLNVLMLLHRQVT